MVQAIIVIEDVTIKNTSFNNLLKVAIEKAKSHSSIVNKEFDFNTSNIVNGNVSNSMTVTLKDPAHMSETIESLASKTLARLQTKVGQSSYDDYGTVIAKLGNYKDYVDQVKVNGKAINVYAADILQSKHSSAAEFLRNIYSTDKTESERYTNLRSKFVKMNYTDAVALLNDMVPSNGDITVPQVTVEGLTLKSAVITKDGKTKLSVVPEITKLSVSDLKTMIKSVLGKTPSDFDGTTVTATMTDTYGRICTYTITFIAK